MKILSIGKKFDAKNIQYPESGDHADYLKISMLTFSVVWIMNSFWDKGITLFKTDVILHKHEKKTAFYAEILR